MTVSFTALLLLCSRKELVLGIEEHNAYSAPVLHVADIEMHVRNKAVKRRMS